MAKRKREIIEAGIEAQDAYYRQKHDKEAAQVAKQKADAIKPNILTRLAAVIVDTLMIVAVFAGLFALTTYVVFPEIGYTEVVNEYRATYAETGLYIVGETGLCYNVAEHYDKEKTPAENYDGRITTYYTVDERCLEADCYATYCEAKLASGLFVQEGDKIVEKEGYVAADYREFYEEEYAKAVRFSESDPVVVRLGSIEMLYRVIAFLIIGLLSSLPFFLIVPLFTRTHATVGQMAFKLSLGSLEDGSPVGKKAVVVRYLIVLLINFVLPVTLYVLDGALAGIPLLVSAACIIFTPKAAGLQDFFSKSRVRNRIEGDPFGALKTAVEMAKQEAAMRGE